MGKYFKKQTKQTNKKKTNKKKQTSMINSNKTAGVSFCLNLKNSTVPKKDRIYQQKPNVIF